MIGWRAGMRRLAILAAPLIALTASLPAQQTTQVSPHLFAELRWRNIGPHRASRTRAAAGHASHPYTFYMAAVNGGVWKTTDAGRVWKPIFDDQPTGSIGTIAIAPSDANTIYVGSGEGLHRPDLSTGDGVYKSTDAGRTWTHLGLRHAQQIPSIAVDPRNPNRLFVAALDHPCPDGEYAGCGRLRAAECGASNGALDRTANGGPARTQHATQARRADRRDGRLSERIRE